MPIYTKCIILNCPKPVSEVSLGIWWCRYLCFGCKRRQVRTSDGCKTLRVELLKSSKRAAGVTYDALHSNDYIYMKWYATRLSKNKSIFKCMFLRYLFFDCMRLFPISIRHFSPTQRRHFSTFCLGIWNFLRAHLLWILVGDCGFMLRHQLYGCRAESKIRTKIFFPATFLYI